MGVRKTESRMPTGLQAADLGEAAVASDGRYALISFLTSPLAVGHENTYVLFVTDAALAGSIKSYDWFIGEDGAFPMASETEIGEINYRPTNAGNITVTARLLDAGDTELGRITLNQEVGPLNPALETLIADATIKPGPGISNPAVMRELVNAYYSYYQGVTLDVPEAGDAFKRFICKFIFDGALRHTYQDRMTLLRQLGGAVEGAGDEFAIIAAEGAGVCNIRLTLLAMTFPFSSPLLEWTELPEAPDKNAVADERLRQRLAAFSEADKIALVNIARFPKTNIKQCARIVETLRDRYFTGASFNDVLTGMSGVRKNWIVRHYLQGPLAR
jgi:hypothetical protein